MNHPFKGQLTLEDKEGSKINVYGTPRDIQILNALINDLLVQAGKTPMTSRVSQTHQVYVLELVIDNKPQGAYFTGRTTVDRRGYSTPDKKEAQMIKTKAEAEFLTTVLKCGRPGGKWVVVPTETEVFEEVNTDGKGAQPDTDVEISPEGAVMDLLRFLEAVAAGKPDDKGPGFGGKIH